MAYEINTKNKSLFLILSIFSLVLTMFITTLCWWFISPRLHEFGNLLATTILTILRAFYIIVICGIIILIISSFTQYLNAFFYRLIRFVIMFLFPVNVLLGKCISISKHEIRESFVKLNNSFLKPTKTKYSPHEILILLPHCLQYYDCTFRITNNISNCNQCKKCRIYQFYEIMQEYKVKVLIATGGTLARKIIIDTKPKCIIAVACEKDLVDGLLDAYPIPVFGVLNERPYGPCVNTTVDVDEIKNFLDNILAGLR